MAYSKFQFIAYDVPTLLLCPPGNFDASRPVPGAEGIKNPDAKARAQRMRDVAAQAANLHGGVLGGADTLKIFVAPEFYFRQDRYSYRDISIVTNLFSALMSAFQEARFNDWLIVPGTVFWTQDAPDPAHDNAAPTSNTTFFNTVMVIRGGAPANAALSDLEKASKTPIVSNGTTNQKSLMSPIDFVLDDNGLARKWDGAINRNFTPIIGDWNWQKAHAFQVKGIQNGLRSIHFGLEVCLEHAETYANPQNPAVGKTANKGALRAALDAWNQHENEQAPAIDLHIITSCGMDICADHVCARAGGYVLLCDGQGTQKLQKVTSARAGATPAVLSPVINPAQTVQVTDNLKVPPPLDGSIPKPQQIKVFPPQLF